MEDLHFSVEDATNYHLLTVEQLEAALRGDIQIFFGGKAKSYKLSPQAFALFKQAEERHFMALDVAQHRQALLALENSFYEYCSITQRCFLMVKYYPYPNRKPEEPYWADDARINEDYAIVICDLFPVRHAFTPQAIEQIRACFNRFRPGLYREAFLEVSSLLSRGKVPEYLAEKVAVALLEIIDSSQAHSAELFLKINGKE